MWMFTRNSRIGEKAKGTTKTDIDALCVGLFECVLKIETMLIDGCLDGTRNTAGRFWSGTWSRSGKRETVENKANGND